MIVGCLETTKWLFLTYCQENKLVRIVLIIIKGRSAMIGFHLGSCWGCGGPHKKGDPGCTAGKFDAHHSAPPMYKAEPEPTKMVSAMLAAARELNLKSNPFVFATNLHSVHKNCGIDSDAGISISTMRSDFPLWLDESMEAKSSIEEPHRP